MPSEQRNAARTKLALFHVAAGVGMAATATQCTMPNKNARPKTGPAFVASNFCLQLVHVGQEFGVVADFFEAADEQFHCLNRRERIENAAKNEDALQVFFGNEQLFLSRSAALNVDGREDALVDELAVENDFHVAGALELFEDDFVHAGAGVNESSCDDGERTAFFNVAGRAEEALRALKGVRVDAAGEDFA